MSFLRVTCDAATPPPKKNIYKGGLLYRVLTGKENRKAEMEPKEVKSRGRPETIAAAEENRQRALSTWNTNVTINDIMTVKKKLDNIMKPQRGDNYALIEQSNFPVNTRARKAYMAALQGCQRVERLSRRSARLGSTYARVRMSTTRIAN